MCDSSSLHLFQFPLTGPPPSASPSASPSAGGRHQLILQLTHIIVIWGGESQMRVPGCPLSPLFYFHLPFSVMGFRTRYPKMWHLSILNIFSWRNGRIACARRTFWPSPKAGHKTLLWERPSLHPEERNVLILKCTEESEWTGLTASPNLLHLAQTLFCRVTFFHHFSLITKPSIKMLRFNCLLRASFPYEGRLLCPTKLILNKSECFSLINLSFVRGGPAKNLERERTKIFFSPLYYLPLCWLLTLYQRNCNSLT